jgi:hypothetical protein
MDTLDPYVVGYLLTFLSIKTVETKVSLLNKSWNSLTKHPIVTSLRTSFDDMVDCPTMLYEYCNFTLSGQLFKQFVKINKNTDGRLLLMSCEKYSRLQKISFTRSSVGDTDILAMVLFLKTGVKEIRFILCDDITKKSLNSIVRYCPSLKFLEIDNCRNVTKGHLERVSQYLPQCEFRFHNKQGRIRDNLMRIRNAARTVTSPDIRIPNSLFIT